MSGDPEQEYFVDGMVEDIITGLSRIKWLFVIARNSSFTYKGKAVDIRQVGRELGVRYVLEGGVRKAGNRLRITAQLIEAETGAHLWADRFDGALDDVFELQDQITDKVVGIVEPSLQRSEIERARRKHPDNLDAYDLYLRALPHMATRAPADARIAAGFLESALKLEPDYAAAHARARLGAIRSASCAAVSMRTTGKPPCAMRGPWLTADARTRARSPLLRSSLRTRAGFPDRVERHRPGALAERLIGGGPLARRPHLRNLRPACGGDVPCHSRSAPQPLRPHGVRSAWSVRPGGDSGRTFRGGGLPFSHGAATLFALQHVPVFHGRVACLGGASGGGEAGRRQIAGADSDFHFRMVREFGFVPAILDKCADAARLLGIPD